MAVRDPEDGSTSARRVAARLLRGPFRDIGRLTDEITGDPGSLGGKKGAALVHRLRVTLRRAEVALLLVRPLCVERGSRKARRRIRDLRRGAGKVRDADVALVMLGEVQERATGRAREAVHAATVLIEGERARARQALVEQAAQCAPRAWRALGAGVWSTARRSRNARAETLIDLAARGLAEDGLALLGPGAMPRGRQVHALRLVVKRLRYAMEAPGKRGDPHDLGVLAETQRRIGELGDAQALSARVAALARSGDKDGPQARLASRCGRLVVLRERELERWWDAGHGASLAGVLARWAGPPPDLGDDALSLGDDGKGVLSGGCLAVVDVGSASVRSLLVRGEPRGTYSRLGQDRASTRLGEGAGPDGTLAERAMGRTLTGVRTVLAGARKAGADVVFAFATAAMRDAPNAGEFARRLRMDAGVEVRVLGHRDEGRLAFLGASTEVDLTTGDAVVFDLGGGSLEVVQSRRGVVVANESLPLGAVRVTHRFGSEGTAEALAAMRAHAGREIARRVHLVVERGALVVGIGGTVRTLRAMAKARDAHSGRGVDREVLRKLIGEVARRSLDERREMEGLPADRADIILAGLVVVDELLERVGGDRVQACRAGLREGVATELIQRASQEATRSAGVRTAKVLERACDQDVPHSQHVARLARSLFDQAVGRAPEVWRDADPRRERTLLHVASLLHDTGILVSYRGHHKHSAQIVRNAWLGGLTEREREVVALVARYHRRRGPRRHDEGYGELGRHERRQVDRLAAILRVADGLDRTHDQRVRSANLSRVDGAWRLRVQSEQDATECVEAALLKGDLFERVMGGALTRAAAPQSRAAAR